MDENFKKPEELSEISEETVLDAALPAGEPEPESPGESSEQVQIISPMRMVMRRFFRSKLSVVGLSVIVFLFLFSFLGPLFSPWGETETDDRPGKGSYFQEKITETITVVEYGVAKEIEVTMYDVTYDQFSQNIYAAPSGEHWLGTDAMGMDVMTRIMYGGRISLSIGFLVVILSTLVGIVLGGLAGYFGKWVDQLIMRIVDIFYCLPQFPMLLIASSLLSAWKVPGQLRIYYLMVILVFFGWAGTARMVRGQILSLREQEFMTATEAAGLPFWRKIFKHLVPNVMPQLIVSMTLSLGSVILTEATLSYLGLGVPVPFAAWGTMISAANNPEILANYFNLWGPPGICIVLAVLAFNFVGDGLRDAFDPKMKR